LRQGLSGSAFPEGLSHASGAAPCRSSAQPPPLESLSLSPGAFQEHAAHTIEWSMMRHSKGSQGACTPRVFPHSSMPLSRRTERRLEAVACRPMILIEAPSSAYHGGRLSLGHRHAHEEETSGASPPTNTHCTAASTCLPAPWMAVSCVRTARLCCTGICQPVPMPCS